MRLLEVLISVVIGLVYIKQFYCWSVQSKYLLVKTNDRIYQAGSLGYSITSIYNDLLLTHNKYYIVGVQTGVSFAGIILIFVLK